MELIPMVKKKGFLIDYNRIEKEIWQLTEPLVASAGAEIVDVEYVKEAGNWYLRIYIDREEPVDLDLCEQVSNLVSAALDKSDPIKQSYFLEISSPGVERPIKRESDFQHFAGSQVLLKLYAPEDGKKEFTGALGGLNEGMVLLETEEGPLSFPLEKVAHVHLLADL